MASREVELEEGHVCLDEGSNPDGVLRDSRCNHGGSHSALKGKVVPAVSFLVETVKLRRTQ